MVDSLLKEALGSYEIFYPKVEFIRHNENETYKVKDTILNREYVLRIHKTNEDFSLGIFGNNKHSIEFLANEIEILDSINKYTELLVQVPVKNKNRELVTVLSNGIPSTLLTWASGKTMDKIELTHGGLFALGEMLGKFHNFSKKCLEKNNIKRYTYDKIFLEQMLFKIKRGVELKIISREQFKIIETSINEISNLIDELDLQKNSKCIVHIDLAKSNLIIN